MSPPSDFHYVKKNCLECDKLLKLNNTRDIERKKFCSQSCNWKHLARERNFIPPLPTKETRKKIGRILSKKMALGLIPKPPQPSKETRKKTGLKMRGENNPNWIKDRSKLKKKRYDCSERDNMVTWRKDVFGKFDYTCQKTGIKGARLVAHHIFNWADNPSLRHDTNNGVVLSNKAHKNFHKTYGVRNNTRQQLDEFLGGF